MQTSRLLSRLLFFMLFVLAPPLDLLRFDLTLGYLVVLGAPWRLGIDAATTNAELSLSILLRIFLPIALVIGIGGWVAWRYGRLYCGWLCPHFAVVEIINGLMRRAIGKPSLWERQPLPQRQADGQVFPRHARYGWLTALAVVVFSALWAVVLLTYLLPPAEVYGNLFNASLTRNQALFLGVATLLFCLEFTLARHLFCRFGCAIGVAQSVLWMGNRAALVVGFDARRAKRCQSCDASCEHVCPMRLRPRLAKRKMFTCTQCHNCIDACAQVQSSQGEVSLLQWLSNDCARAVAKNVGQAEQPATHCFQHHHGGPRPPPSSLHTTGVRHGHAQD